MSPFLEELIDGLGDALKVIVIGVGVIAGVCIVLILVGRLLP